jgi:hypothetical protein
MPAQPSVGVGGVWKPLGAISVGVGAAWKPVANAWVGVAGSWQPFFASLSCSISAGSSANGSTASHTFGGNTVTVVGGIGPFTYQWHESDDGAGTWAAGGTSATQTVSVSGVFGGGNSSTATYYCVVTDTGAGGNTATSGTASYTWTHN